MQRGRTGLRKQQMFNCSRPEKSAKFGSLALTSSSAAGPPGGKPMGEHALGPSPLRAGLVCFEFEVGRPPLSFGAVSLSGSRSRSSRSNLLKLSLINFC